MSAFVPIEIFYPNTAVCNKSTAETWMFKGCVHYIFASFLFKSKREHLWNLEEKNLFHFKSFFRSRENQILEL